MCDQVSSGKKLIAYFCNNVISCCIAISIVLGSIIYLWSFKSVGIFPIVDLSTGWLLLGTASLSMLGVVILIFAIVHIPTGMNDMSGLRDDPAFKKPKPGEKKDGELHYLLSFALVFSLPSIIGAAIILLSFFGSYCWSLISGGALAIYISCVFRSFPIKKYSRCKFILYFIINTFFNVIYLLICGAMTFSILQGMTSFSDIWILSLSLTIVLVIGAIPFLAQFMENNGNTSFQGGALLLSGFLTLVVLALISSKLPEKILSWYKLGSIKNVEVILDDDFCKQLGKVQPANVGFDRKNCTLSDATILSRLGSEIHIKTESGDNLVIDKENIAGWLER